MRKLIVTTLLALFLAPAAQVQAQGVHAGMIRTQATLALGVPFNMPMARYFIYGEAEVLLSDNIGFNGGAYFMIDQSETPQDWAWPATTFDHRAHSVFFGPNYHFLPDSPFDVYVGLQPGVQLSAVTLQEVFAKDQWSLNPVASMNVGAALYGSFFHLFTQVRAVYGEHDQGWFHSPMSDLRFTVGLGFNFF